MVKLFNTQLIFHGLINMTDFPYSVTSLNPELLYVCYMPNISCNTHVACMENVPNQCMFNLHETCYMLVDINVTCK